MQQLFAVHHPRDCVQTHLVKFLGRHFKVAGNLLLGEQIIPALIPIALAIDGMKVEPFTFRRCAPVRAFLDTDLFHGPDRQPPKLLLPPLLLPPQPLRAEAWLPKPPREIVDDTEDEPEPELPRLRPSVLLP